LYGNLQDLKLSKLDQELGTTRSDLNKLKSTKIQSTEDADVTVQIISQLEQRLQHLSQEYKLLTASIQGCQTKYLTIEDQVQK
jgi:chromosome segregation ATPase